VALFGLPPSFAIASVFATFTFGKTVQVTFWLVAFVGAALTVTVFAASLTAVILNMSDPVKPSVRPVRRMRFPTATSLKFVVEGS
jgi:hypothetical protein